MRKYKLQMPAAIGKVLKSYPAMDLEDFVNKNNQHLVTEDGLDLLKKMLVYDKNLRATPIEAMNHRYFDPVK